MVCRGQKDGQAGRAQVLPGRDQLHRDARALAWRLADKGPFEAIVCITRGGAGPGGDRGPQLDLKLVETVCVTSYHDYAQGDIKLLKPISASVAEIGNGRGKGVLLIDEPHRHGQDGQARARDAARRALRHRLAKPVGAPMCHFFITEVSQNTWIYFPWHLDLRSAEEFVCICCLMPLPFTTPGQGAQQQESRLNCASYRVLKWSYSTIWQVFLTCSGRLRDRAHSPRPRRAQRG
jgi:xanthine phosphoribosyltransferase